MGNSGPIGAECGKATEDACKAIERFLEVSVLGNQSELKFKAKRAEMAQNLVQLARKVNY